MYLPDGLLTSGFYKQDVGTDPNIIAADPFASDDCLNVLSPVYQFLPLEPEEPNTMNTSDDEPTSVLNGRLRPRKSAISNPLSINHIMNKYDGKQTQEKHKRSNIPSKASPSKPEDLSNNADPSLTAQLLCPYCNKKFGSKQTVSKHIRRLHISASKIESSIVCLFCSHVESEPSHIIRHMIDSHPNQYFACLECHTRFPSTKELAEHKLNICEKQKIPYRSKLRRKTTKKNQKVLDSNDKDDYSGHGFNGIVISCELKPTHIHDDADIEDNITTNLILPPNKNISTSSALEKNAVIVLDDIQWNRRIPSNFSFHNTDADQILSRLGVVHRSPKTGESTKKDLFRAIEDATQKFEKCFDTSFYSKVASNVQENLTKFLDGSFNFNPDPDSTIKTRKSKNSVVINTAEGFPILLACEQFSRNTYDGYIPRTIAPKHKWKWDNLENEKSWNSDQIKRDTHANNCIITLVSSLDIWTQIRMRRKFEDIFNITPVEKKAEKQNVISEELKEILESREIPESNSQIVKYVSTPLPTTNEDFPTSLGLIPSAPKFNVKPAILSGEWVRPRCYVCCACGAQSRDSRTLSAHVSSKHPNAQVQHYEIVGESLLKADILKHLYVPPNQNINRTRPPRGFRDCTKCMKSITIEDLHQHMLDCAGDTPAVRRKCRYRPFGVRKRRPRLPDNRIRKKMRNDIRTRSSRQKNRMRSKQKIRSEVGDAETIRKMLADLPAKRHRVVVNPLNSILRPRRKLDKQRALLLRKLHTSEDLKTTKPKASNTTLRYSNQQISSDTDKHKSVTNGDDEDNEPLKPRLKRVACKLTRQKESLNRNAVLKKPKRNVRLLIDEKENEDDEKEFDVSISCPVNVQTDQLSIDHNEKRINVNGDLPNGREHSSGRGDTNNSRRDNQRPGCSGQNGNSRNVCAPTQNVPLKHSIARLTANSETHDKSVQFHHLFLVQQECNNTNEHLPTGQRVLFENEAVVTKLDKPPLHFHQNNSLETVQEHIADPVQENNLESLTGHTCDSIQKSKLNKPRKGLNDCIAMLKNKLVDTDPNAPARVSVQCGTDDLLSTEPALTSTSTFVSPRIDVVMKSCPAGQVKKSSLKRLSRNEQLPKPLPMYGGQYFNHDVYGHINNERQIKQWRPFNYDAIMPRYIDSRTRKESSRRKSVTLHDQNFFYAQQLLSAPHSTDDMLIKLSAESYNAYNYAPRKCSKVISEQFNVDNNRILSHFGKRGVIDKNPLEASNGSLENCEKNMKNLNAKSLDSYKKNTRIRINTSKKPAEILDENVIFGKDISKSTKNFNEKYQNKTFDILLQGDDSIYNAGKNKIVHYPQIIRRKKTNNVNTEVNSSQLKQVELPSKTDKNVKIPTNIYTENNLNDNSVSIPLAHASTNAETILSEPLDLSSKGLAADPDYLFRQDLSLFANNDSYETLDLSNKRRTSLENFIEDEVVDLRVKHNLEYPRLSALKLPCSSSSQQKLSTITAFNLVHQNECIPTDLSLKRRDENTNLCINLSQKRNINETEIQDLSKNKNKTVSLENRFLDEELPTDLCIKRVRDALIVKESNINETNATLTKCDELKEQNKPNDLTGQSNVEKLNDSHTKILTTEKHATTEQNNDKLNEAITNENEIIVTSTTGVSCKTVSQIHKPMYDPILRIPQYKIRPVTTNSISKDINVTVPLTVISTCVENYSSNQILINSTHSTCIAFNSTGVKPSMIASIEAQERITYSFTKSVINNATSVTGSAPTYSLLNRGITTPFTTFESTRPVYALPNACISMAKIDVTTNNLLSIPSTTIMSTSPVYTLAGTTLVTPLNYVTLPNNGQSIPYPPPRNTYLTGMDSQIRTEYTSPSSVNIHERRTYNSNILIRGATSDFEHDQDITRQVIILPKEIMALLKTMSVDYRNQLLDVLLHYLSSSRPLQPISSTQTSLIQNVRPSILSMPIRLSRETTVDTSTDTVNIKPLFSLPTVKGRRKLQRNVKSNKTLSNSSVQHADLLLHNDVIDLTYDEIVPKIDLDSEVNSKQPILLKAKNRPIAPVLNIHKTNNDKTASLRAVRIKAPSERQQLKILANPVESLSYPHIPCVPSNDNYDKELHQSLQPTISSDIQMYEISSTQSNKNIISENESSHRAPLQSTSDNVMKSHCNLIVNERGESQQSQLIKKVDIGNTSVNNIISHETKTHETVTENVNLSNNNDVHFSIERNFNETDRNSVKILPKGNESTMTYNLSGIDNDDDSEDDISLAVIVKQRQQNQNKLKVNTSDHGIKTHESDIKANDKNISSNKQPNQQIKQTISPETFVVQDIRETINNKIDVQAAEIERAKTNKNNNEPSLCTDEIEHISGDDIVKSKQLKKKGKKSHINTSTVKKVKKLDKKEININITNDDELQNVKNSQEYNFNLNSIQQDVTSVETTTVLPTVEDKVSENVDISKNTAQEQPNDIVRDEIGNKNKLNCTENIKLLEAFPQDINHELISVEKSTPEQNCIVQQVDTSESLDDDNGNLLASNSLLINESMKSFIEDDIELPLRRSKRGKSLFIEGNDQSLIYPDNFLEHKAPLTKKQLIFSKLLLDEEKSLKISAPIDDNQTLREESTCLRALPEKYTEEKNKSVKRKKPTHSKNKSKKKKSIHSSEYTISDEIRKAFVQENSFSEHDRDNILTSLSATEDHNESYPDPNCKMDLDPKVALSQKKNDTDNNNKLLTHSTIKEQDKIAVSRSTVKRKIEPLTNDHLETVIFSSKPKKSKSNNVNDILGTFHSEMITSNKSNLNTSYNLPGAARRGRSKSVVVKSSGAMLYDPYDIDLEDMGDETEPFRKQRSMLLKTCINKLPQENHRQMCITNKDINIQPEINLKTIAAETMGTKYTKETISDSDESSKSDVPLKKYVEEKERKNQLCESGNTTLSYQKISDKTPSNDGDMKQSRKKHKKNKRSSVAIDNVQREDKYYKEVSEEQRSEQFMESFGFFSERKPRKSNLLATKKISETFHNIATESDDAYLDTKERPFKKSSRSERKKAVDEVNSAKYNKHSDVQKLPTKCDKNLKLRSATLYCHLCKKEFRRIDNLVRHQLSLLHASKLSENALALRTLPNPDDLNYLVIFQEHMDRAKMLEHKMKSKKQSKTKFKFPTFRQLFLDVRKYVREKQLARRNLSRDQALFLDCCELLNDSNRGQIEDRNIRRPFFPCCPSSHALACTSSEEYDPKTGLSLEFSRYAKCVPNLSKKPIIHTSAFLSRMANFVALSNNSKQARKPDFYALPFTSGLVHCCKTTSSRPSILGEVIDAQPSTSALGLVYYCKTQPPKPALIEEIIGAQPYTSTSGLVHCCEARPFRPEILGKITDAQPSTSSSGLVHHCETRPLKPGIIEKIPDAQLPTSIAGLIYCCKNPPLKPGIMGEITDAQPSTSFSGLVHCYETLSPKPGIIGEIIDTQPSIGSLGLVDYETRPSNPLITGETTDKKDDSKSEDDVDSLTAQNILESEEVKNLENDLITGLKEAACKFKPLPSEDKIIPKNIDDSCPEIEINVSEKKQTISKVKSSPDTKEKKNLDIIENIDIFEDKFDKIKRKCRSQAAAAKLAQISVEPSTSHKSRKKSDKKKGKRNSKKYNQNTVLTKGALKGYDSIKVSILTSEINMSAIVPPIVASSKKKKKRSSKKKRDRKKSISTRKLDSNGCNESFNKNIDVYEFLDNEEPEIFELRPSTLMERFRNLNKKDVHNSSKTQTKQEEVVSSDSMSDGDDFVYMSDDYVCSDDETENSLMSCELGNVKGSNEVKKSFSSLKRKDVMEKNAVMGKIFKHNAVRSEKKSIKHKESTKPKANLDQLFDSLLEEEPNSTEILNDAKSPKRDSCIPQKKRVFSPIVLSKYDSKNTTNFDSSLKKHRSPSPASSSDSVLSRRISSYSSRQSSPQTLSSNRFDVTSPFDYEPSTSKRFGDSKKYNRMKGYELTSTKTYDSLPEKMYDLSVPNNHAMNKNLVLSSENDEIPYNAYKTTAKDRTSLRKKEKVVDYGIGYDYKADYYDDAFSDDAGVARQRARRKCTVGKQNILAETWSSESELDCVPPRPNSAESVVLNVARKKKGRKREGQICGGRKGNKHVSVKKQDFESRVTNNNRNTGASSGLVMTNRPSGSSSAYTQQLSLPGPSGIGPRLRPTTSFWADGDEEPEHVQQHGWIVGDSHKKLVTMLAHAKGRKRNNDDKVRLME